MISGKFIDLTNPWGKGFSLLNIHPDRSWNPSNVPDLFSRDKAAAAWC
jgi:hypothetical protein